MSKYSILTTVLLSVFSGSALADTATLNPTDGSYIMGSQPNDNFGSVNISYVGSFDAGAMYGTVLFDLSPYSGVTINDASLQLYISASGGAFPPNNPWIARFTGSWDESTITWNNQPGWDEWYYTGTNPPLNDWWDIDVTTWTTAWVNGSQDNYGMFLGAESLNPADYVGFRTKEYSGSTYTPKLVLDYTPPVSIKSASIGEIKAAFK